MHESNLKLYPILIWMIYALSFIWILLVVTKTFAFERFDTNTQRLSFFSTMKWNFFSRHSFCSCNNPNWHYLWVLYLLSECEKWKSIKINFFFLFVSFKKRREIINHLLVSFPIPTNCHNFYAQFKRHEMCVLNKFWLEF